MSASAMRLTLLDGERRVRIENVASLVAADASGQFGLLPGHAGLITVLEPGLFRYRRGGTAEWTFAACAGGLLSCTPAGVCTDVRIVSRRFLQGAAPEAMQAQLDELLARRQALVLSTREDRERLDLALLRRLQRLAEVPA